MNTLFHITPPGFVYEDNFITAGEEQELINVIQQTQLNNMMFQGFEAKRKVANFGMDWSFEKRVLSKGRDIPDPFQWLIERVALYIKVPQTAIAELLITEYPVGAVINWHCDAPPFDRIAGVSLMSDCKFKFRPYSPSMRTRKDTISVPVRQRSIYIMQEESRSDWEHSISPHTAVRYSITLRTLRG